MKIKLKSSYRNSNGTIVFVYKVSGTKSQIAQFVEAQGEYIKYEDNDETKSPLFFNTSYAGESGSLIITQAGKVVIDNTEANKMASLIEQHKGTALGDALALQLATKMMKEMSSKSSAPAEKVATPTPENSVEDLDAL